jgi:hypothetical protein
VVDPRFDGCDAEIEAGMGARGYGIGADLEQYVRPWGTRGIVRTYSIEVKGDKAYCAHLVPARKLFRGVVAGCIRIYNQRGRLSGLGTWVPDSPAKSLSIVHAGRSSVF